MIVLTEEEVAEIRKALEFWGDGYRDCYCTRDHLMSCGGYESHTPPCFATQKALSILENAVTGSKESKAMLKGTCG